jgi:hypothetical protein
MVFSGEAGGIFGKGLLAHVAAEGVTDSLLLNTKSNRTHTHPSLHASHHQPPGVMH